MHADLIGTVLFPILALVGGVPLIGWAKPVPVNGRFLRHPRRDFVLVAAAGPASNLVLAVISALLLALLPNVIGPGTSAGAVAILNLFGQALRLNVLLAVFNMLPIPPLDGGNVLSGLLPRPLGAAFDRLRPYGFLLLYVLMFTGAYRTLLYGPASVLLSWLT